MEKYLTAETFKTSKIESILVLENSIRQRVEKKTEKTSLLILKLSGTTLKFR